MILQIIERSLSLEFLFKITCVGTKRKSQIIRCYVEGKFTTNYLPSLGVDITAKQVNLHGLLLNLIIVDTAGQEFFGKLRTSYYKGSSGCIIFFDATEGEDLLGVKEWYHEFRVHIPDSSVPVVLVRIMSNNEITKTDEKVLLIEEQALIYYTIREDDTNAISQIFDSLLTQILKLRS